VPAGRSATAAVDGEDQYTPFGYSHITRRVLAVVLLTRNQHRTIEASTGGRTIDDDRGPASTRPGYTTDIVEVVERYLYRPLIKPTLRLARWAKAVAVRAPGRLRRLHAHYAHRGTPLAAAVTTT
jgi:hypothetical protein